MVVINILAIVFSPMVLASSIMCATILSLGVASVGPLPMAALLVTTLPSCHASNEHAEVAATFDELDH